MVASLNEEEVREFLLPRVVHTVTPYEFLVRKSTTMPYRQPTFSEISFSTNYEQLCEAIKAKHPIVSNYVTNSKKMSVFIDDRHDDRLKCAKTPKANFNPI